MPEPEKTTPVVNTNANPAMVLEPEQTTREISQTDHLNKKLLTSLFKRMNEGDSTISKMLEPDNNTEEDDEWN